MQRIISDSSSNFETFFKYHHLTNKKVFLLTNICGNLSAAKSNLHQSAEFQAKHHNATLPALTGKPA